MFCVSFCKLIFTVFRSFAAALKLTKYFPCWFRDIFFGHFVIYWSCDTLFCWQMKIMRTRFRRASWHVLPHSNFWIFLLFGRCKWIFSCCFSVVAYFLGALAADVHLILLPQLKGYRMSLLVAAFAALVLNPLIAAILNATSKTKTSQMQHSIKCGLSKYLWELNLRAFGANKNFYLWRGETEQFE